MSQQHKGTALITGAARGLGRAFAERLAKAGFDIVAVDISDSDETAEEIERIGRKVKTLKADISDESSIQSMADEAEEFAAIDVLVNNAGIYPEKPFSEMSFEDWRKVMSLNLDGPFLVTKALLPGMLERGFGRIINVASAEVAMMVPGNTHYIASKMGVIGLTRGLASEVGDHGVTVNAISPGLTRTPGSTGAPQQVALFEMLPKMQAIKRPGEPNDIVGVAAFLASEDARFITGQTIVADGGLVRL